MTQTSIREDALRHQETQVPTDIRPADNAAYAIKVYKAADRRVTCGANV